MTKQNKKRGSILATFVVLKKGGTLGFPNGAGEERNRLWPFRQRARRRAEERNALTSKSSHASDSLQLQIKRPLSGGLSVELEGVEPSSKQVTDVLSTCLFRG